MLKRKWVLVTIVAMLTIVSLAVWVGYKQGEICSSCWNTSSGDIQEEIVLLEIKANAGDSSAAYELSGLYSIYLEDEVKSKMWLEKAATLGHPLAKQRIDRGT